jgi:general secretion pathway protein A
MYEQHFHFRQLPFSIAPDPSFLYLSSAHREALAHLMYGFSHGGFVMVTGEVGTGKTTLLRNLIKQTPPELDVAFILNPRLTVRELLATLCDELGIQYNPDTTNSVKQFVDLITRHLLKTHQSGRSTVMIIDEAQNLSPAVLEQVRLLTNLETDDRKLLRIILIGQPELAEMLDRQELRQLAQRVTARYHLGSLSRPDTYAYVMHRLSRAGGNPHTFSSAALRRLYALSHGTPRLINVIADRALLGAYTEGRHQVTARIVNRAAREVLGKGPDRRKWWLAAAVAVMAAGAAWAILGPVGQVIRSAPGASALTDATLDPATARSREPAADPAKAIREQTVPHSRPAVTAQAKAPTPQTTAPITTNESGDSVITPATYAALQEAQRQRQPTPQALQEAVPPSAPSNVRASDIARPPGSAYANRRLAYAAVFDRWGVRFDVDSAEPIPCDFAPSAGLQCLSERGEWADIARLNLPVVLELWDNGPAPYYAALIGLHGADVELQLGAKRITTTQRALRDVWAGRYVVLWQTPPGYRGNLRLGETHETVGWLREQLSGLTSRPLASSNPNLFDESLRGAVLEFQSEEGLNPDGIVGPDTWIRLSSRLRLPQPSLAG